jgi:hypothetical protein
MLNVIMLNVIMLNVIMQIVVMLNVMPPHRQFAMLANARLG